ncbi:DNA binding protein [Aureococcus anophagefferens]|nr:DNA binding protein [Aureococcus anophagefferens]
MFLATAVRSCRAFVPRAGLTMAPVRAPVRMFNTAKGYGFITPDNGGGDVVHQTQIYARGFRSLAEGENVEFEIEMDQNGRERAVSVTGPEGDYVQGAPRPEPRYEDSY